MQHAAVREAARRTVHSSRPDSGTARRHIEPPIRHSPAVAGGVRPFDQSGLSDHRSGNVTLHEGLATRSCKKGSKSDAHVEVDLTGRPNRLVRVARVNRPSGTGSCLRRRADQSNCRNARHKASQAGMMHGERSWATPGTVVVRVVGGRSVTVVHHTFYGFAIQSMGGQCEHSQTLYQLSPVCAGAS